MANPNLKGPLLKPGERGKAPGPGLVKATAEKRTPAAKAQDRFEFLKNKIKTWLKDRFEVADALREIRDDKLYKKDYRTFEECCTEEFGFSRTYAYGLIDASQVKESLKMSSIQDTVTNVSQARALSAVPEKKRETVLTRAAKSGPVTARSITAAATAGRKKPAPKVIDVEPVTSSTPVRELSFVQGVVWACARLIEMYDQPSMAVAILRESGAEDSDLKGCAEYDLAYLRKEDPKIPRGID